MKGKITLAITGASGMPFAVELLKQLLLLDYQVNLIISKAGVITFHQELSIALAANPQQIKTKLVDSLNLPNADLLFVYGIDDWYAPMASGSSVNEAMVICPCSMATLGRIANGCDFKRAQKFNNCTERDSIFGDTLGKYVKVSTSRSCYYSTDSSFL